MPKGIERNLTNYGDAEFSKYMRRAFLASAGYDRVDLDRPVIGIVDTSSDYNTCHRQMPEMVAAVKRGVLEAGGLPMAFPTISLHEILTSPTAMLYRNLQAMDTEAMISGQPMDGVVLLGGCDKTLPAQVMAATSANIPAVVVSAGPMITGSWRGERLGACTDCRRYWARHRAGELSEAEIEEIEQSLCFTGGTCMVMGTATTMACLMEALGMMLPGGAVAPHASGDRLKACVASGRQAVALARNELKPSDILTREAFENAMVALMALAGSTNAIIHLTAIARRAGITLSLRDFDRVGRAVPVLVNCKPAGQGYAEDLHHAGGMPVLLKTLEPLLNTAVMTAAGVTLGETLRLAEQPGVWQDIIRPLDRPLKDPGALAALYGSLAPDGAVIKSAAATPALMQHRGPAVVFHSLEDLDRRLDDPALGITPEHIMVLQNAGPVAEGMPEAGSFPIPRYLAARGVKDMVRISDARMSGTSYGTVVLHACPEAAVGGPLGLVRDGDVIELDVAGRRVDLLVDERELERRRAEWQPPARAERGWRKLYQERVLQAHLGCDLDFM